jgi:uncharacterized protein YraI
MPIWTRHYEGGRVALAALTVMLAALIVGAPLYSAAAATGDLGPQTSINQQLAQPIVIVNTSYLNIRSGPGPIYSSIGVLPGGTELPVVARNADTSWWQVQSAFGRGWVYAEYVIPRGDFRAVPVGNVTEPATYEQALAVVQTEPVTVYIMPNLSSDVLGIALAASALRITGQTVDGGWWQVETNVGLGWIRQEAVTLQGTGDVAVYDMAAANVPVTTTLEVQPQYARTYIIVNTSYLNIRSGPGGQFTVVHTVNGGTELDITGSTPDAAWYRVSSAFGSGWVDAEFVIFRGVFAAVPIVGYAEAVAPAAPAAVAIVSAPINVYLGWGVETGLLGTAPAGLNLEVVGRTLDGAWFQVNTSLGVGWVLTSTVTFRGNINQVPVVG